MKGSLAKQIVWIVLCSSTPKHKELLGELFQELFTQAVQKYARLQYIVLQHVVIVPP
jgi:hypothetical protein